MTLDELLEDFKASLHVYNWKVLEDFPSFLLIASKLANVRNEYRLPLSRISKQNLVPIWNNLKNKYPCFRESLNFGCFKTGRRSSLQNSSITLTYSSDPLQSVTMPSVFQRKELYDYQTLTLRWKRKISYSWTILIECCLYIKAWKLDQKMWQMKEKMDAIKIDIIPVTF